MLYQLIKYRLENMDICIWGGKAVPDTQRFTGNVMACLSVRVRCSRDMKGVEGTPSSLNQCISNLAQRPYHWRSISDTFRKLDMSRLRTCSVVIRQLHLEFSPQIYCSLSDDVLHT
eukprot:TRINITY_DN4572_c0_g3_i1.p1 TRINITY_DN4572_c0_g3~~TRINITY_DN4572_c0_g3_i1.p1  ORF type:complete len:116 (-),score=1.18 TRINITY_DN4572_c0_g3_i1:141-488(-)